MRPFVLSPLFSSISGLSSVGPKTTERFQKMGIHRVWDLLKCLPHKIEKRTFLSTLKDASLNEKVTMSLRVISHTPRSYHHKRHEVSCLVDDIPIGLVFFHAYGQHLTQKMPLGSTRLVSGTLEKRAQLIKWCTLILLAALTRKKHG